MVPSELEKQDHLVEKQTVVPKEEKAVLSKEEYMQKKIDHLISTNKVMMFSKSYCPFCMMTKKLLKKKNVSLFALELDQDPEGDLMHSTLKKMSGHNTVPNVYINGKHIGGNDTLQELEY